MRRTTARIQIGGNKEKIRRCRTKEWRRTTRGRVVPNAFPGGGPKGSLRVISIGLASQLDTIQFIAFTLSDVIKKYGAPNWVVLWSEGTPEHVGVSQSIVR